MKFIRGNVHRWFMLMVLVAFPVFAQVVQLEPVEVTGTRMAGFETLRSVEVISREEIRRSGASSIDQLLEHLIGLESRNRAPFGIQADLIGRGSQFQQVLILVDGIPYRNPQTAHHALNLPLGIADLERIEVLRGHGSAVYGTDAFGAVVHLITRSRGTGIQLGVGDHGLWEYRLRGSLPVKVGHLSASLGRIRSDGFAPDREFDRMHARFGVDISHRFGRFRGTLGFQDKDFGAFDFYTPGAGFASLESTRTLSASVGEHLSLGGWHLTTRAYWNRGKDHFILDRNGRSDFSSRHTTDQYGLEQTIRRGYLLLGLAAEGDRIESLTLGQGRRTRWGFFGEVGQVWKEGKGRLGLRVERYRLGWEWSPELSLGYRAFRLAVGRSFRLPSYTELFYVSPQNVGDPELRAERAWNYELGWRPGRLDLTVYHRQAHNLIDWARTDASQPWHAQNLREVSVTGAEVLWRWSRLSLGYGYQRLSTAVPPTYQSKYVLHVLEHQASLRLTFSLPLGVEGYLGGSYRVVSGSGVPLIDLTLSRTWGAVRLQVSGTNLLDQTYEEIPGVPQPGRWIRWQVRYEP